MECAENNKWLGFNQTGERKHTSAMVTATINELIIKLHRVIRTDLWIHQDDTISRYDRILRGHIIFNSRKFHILYNICKFHGSTHDKMRFKTQLNNKISNIKYKSTEQIKLNGAGQGTGNSGTHWSFISIIMMGIVAEVAPRCTQQLPKGKKEWKIDMIRFVDHKRHYVNSPHLQLKTAIKK